MRLVRYGEPGREKAGIVDGEGNLRAISPLVTDWTVEHLSDEWQHILAALDPAKLPKVDGDIRIAAPISGISQLLGIGLNYRDHAAEANMAIPDFPMLFQKALGSISGPYDDILLGQGAEALDWEAELAVVVRKRGRHIALEDAYDYIGGYMVAADISERDWQFSHGGLHNKGKSYDSFTPLGPWLVTPQDVVDPQSLHIWLTVNQDIRQDASTSEMIFSVAECIAHISKFQTLLPGDVILTGTPAGVGFGMDPRMYLRPGDIVALGVDDLGKQKHRVVPEG
ncbi:fumarylacetoacetate hydrolase family protein [Sphingobium sp. TB-6]|nr:fumarylacetoacetate hydrolase family protein [Sphingobium sp. TB-6]AMK25287.1 2-hydroxyhepta-2,4-diene-1,7-dioate isomerase [Sphingobium sp. TKS]NML87943.1 fumarylacetoacetate hydrolase family protein [Sphingobium sp. TB-6]